MPAEHKKVEKQQPPAAIDVDQNHAKPAAHLNTPLPVPGIPPKPDQVKGLQRVIGNQAVIRLMKSGNRLNRLNRRRSKRAPDGGETMDESSLEGLFESGESEHQPDIVQRH